MKSRITANENIFMGDIAKTDQGESTARAARARKRIWRSRYVLNRAVDFFKRGLLKEAEIFLREAIHREPGSAGAHALRGLILLKTFDNKGAIEALSHSIMLDDTKPTVIYNRALAYHRLGMRALELKGDEPGEEALELLMHAVDDYTRTIQLDKFCAEAYANRAGCYARLRKMKKAGKDMNLAVQLMDGDSMLHLVHNAVRNRATSKKKSEAEKEIDEGHEDLNLWDDEKEANVSDYERSRRKQFGRLRRKSISQEGTKGLVKLLRARSKVMTKLGNTAASQRDEDRANNISARENPKIKAL